MNVALCVLLFFPVSGRNGEFNSGGSLIAYFSDIGAELTWIDRRGLGGMFIRLIDIFSVSAVVNLIFLIHDEDAADDAFGVDGQAILILLPHQVIKVFSSIQGA